MTIRLYRAQEVCEMADVQPYVLRSWEKEFPGIGVQRTPDGGRLYRQADIDQVLRIKQLVFGEGLTVSGARRRLDDSGPPKVSAAEAAEVLDTLGSAARNKVATVRDGLRALQTMLAQRPGDFMLSPPPVKQARSAKAADKGGSAKSAKANGKEHGKSPARSAKPAKTVIAKRGASSSRVAARKPADAKRRRASA